MDIKASIIILSYGHSEMTHRCVVSVADTLSSSLDQTEIIVFDNSSDAQTVSALEALERVLPFTLIKSDMNLGFAAGCNAASQHAGGETLIFLNNDITALPNWHTPLLDALAGDGCGVAGSLLLYPDGRIQHAGIGLGLWGLPVPLGVGATTDSLPGQNERKTLAVTGACLAIRRSVFDRVGGFDERYFFSYEDADLCLRVRDAEFEIVTRLDSRLVHHESYTARNISTINKRREAEQIFSHRWDQRFQPFITSVLNAIAATGIKGVAIYGTGQAGQTMLRKLRTFQRLPVVCFIDSHASLHAAQLEGLSVCSPASIPDAAEVVLPASVYMDEILTTAAANGFREKVITTIFDSDDI